MLTLATQHPPRLTPRSKHIAVKYHWFCSQLGETIQLKYIPTNDQLAEILTKPLSRVKFECDQEQLMGFKNSKLFAETATKERGRVSRYDRLTRTVNPFSPACLTTYV